MASGVNPRNTMTTGASCRLAWLAPCLLTACAVSPPVYDRSAAPIPPAYERGGEETAAPTGWRNYFADPGLLALIEQALANNRDVRAAALRVAEMRALYGIQRSYLFPEIGAYGSGERARTPAGLSVTGRDRTENVFQVGGVLASWEIDFWGRVRSLKRAALEEYLASDAARRAFTISLIADVANTWLAQREYDQRIELARRSVATREESFRIFSRRFAVGASTKLELKQVEALLIQAHTLSAQLEQARELNGHRLALLVGGPVDLTPRTGVLDGQGGIRPLAPGLPAELLTNRPDIVAAEHRLVAAEADIHAARAAFLPNISLTGSLGLASPELDDLFDAGRRAWNFTPSLSVPIFNAGRLRASLDAAEVRRDIAVAEYERLIQNAFREVSDALSSHHWLDRQLEIRRRGLDVERERATLAQLSYDKGATTYLDVLDAQRELLQAEQDAVATQRQLLASQIDLFAALGGGRIAAAQPEEDGGNAAAPLPADDPNP
jgi:multidrug efflux system outer membrane protein